MAIAKYNTRVLQKHDTKENWDKATNFIPLLGEIVVYDDLNAIKIGDGVTKVADLPFQNDCLIGSLQGKYVTQTAGGIQKGTQINMENVEELLTSLLGLSSGVAPAQGSFNFTISPTSITPALGTTSATISATWSITDNETTYTGNYTPTIGGKTGTASASGGTISGITVSYADTDTSKTISGQATYVAGAGFPAGTLTDTARLTIYRFCYDGVSGNTLSSTSRTSKSGWSFEVTLASQKAVFQYPKVWGTVNQILDGNNYDVTDIFVRTEVTKNGGTYYQYELNAANTGTFEFKIS